MLGYLAGGMSEAEILEQHPSLTSEAIRACLAFAAERERRRLCVPAAWRRRRVDGKVVGVAVA